METGKLSIFLTVLLIGVKLSTTTPVTTTDAVSAATNLVETGKAQATAATTAVTETVTQGLSAVPGASAVVSNLQNTKKGLENIVTSTLPKVLDVNLEAVEKTTEALATGVTGMTPEALQPTVKQLTGMPNNLIKMVRTGTASFNPLSLFGGQTS
ncbi:uncharacterized protein LOC142325505 [Lycorma delicatula]|uniref:uncharacterized protein LOC142325505 n=1 Tax=Lycorma delicatula TaxID=130591 RepID=UPI003F515C06